MRREPDLEALRVLSIVAERGSISAASGMLGVSQQAVSQRVRGLEREMRAPLLVRTSRGSSLTPSGELVVAWAAPLLAAADEYAQAAASLSVEQGRRLRIAASLTIAEHLLPEWIAQWRMSSGENGMTARLTAANSIAVIEEVRAGAVDLGFIETPAVPAELGSVTIGHDTIEIVVPRTHRWAAGGSVSLAELADTPLVLREEGSGTRRALADAMRAAGHPLRAEPEAVHSTTLGVRSAVMAGVAPGALSVLAVSEDVRRGRLARVRIEGLEIVRPLTAVWRGAEPSAAAAALLEVIAGVAPPTR